MQRFGLYPKKYFMKYWNKCFVLKKKKKEGKKKRDKEEEALIMEREIKRGKEREREKS